MKYRMKENLIKEIELESLIKKTSFMVPRVDVVHRFDCTIIEFKIVYLYRPNIFHLRNAGNVTCNFMKVSAQFRTADLTSINAKALEMLYKGFNS
jgi:hypothetical protein